MTDIFTGLALAGVAVSTAAWVVVAHGRRIAAAMDALHSIPREHLAAFLVFAAIATLSAQKPDGGTNDPPQMMMGHPLAMQQTPSVSSEDLVRGYRFDCEFTSAAYSYAMPANGARYSNWWLRGAYEDVFRLDLGGMGFPLADELLSSLWVYSWGMVGAHLGNPTSRVVATGVPMSAVPGLSQFWSADSADGSKLLTWQDFALNRDTNTLVSAQLELFPDGDFIARSNEVVRVFRRVNPDDWDDDGDPNDEDEEPLIASEPAFGPHQELPHGANSNAYYWVDVVVSNASSLVTFIGDGTSALPDPSFIAQPGETNRVTLLIGKTYHATSRMPMTCVGKSNVEIETWQDSPTSLSFLWPVTIDVVAMRDGLSFAMTVTPSCLGGGFTWTNSCCSVSSSGWTFTYSCDENCHCTGCAALGCYTYEGFMLPASGGSCGCSAEGGPDIAGTNEPPVSASVSVSFSQKVLFYESKFVNSLGVVVPEHCETNVMLSCSVSGGARGGTFSLALENFDKLAWTGGDSLPSSPVELGAGERRSWTATYEYASHSDDEDDVRATGRFAETLSGDFTESSDSMTVVMLTTAAAELWPTNMLRRTFGVGEEVVIYKTPNIMVSALPSRGSCYSRTSHVMYCCPHSGGEDAVVISAKNCSHTLEFDICEPDRYVVLSATSNITAAAGESGGFGLNFMCRLLPSGVSFKNVQIIELPCVSIDPVGYYAQPSKTNILDHGGHGAGNWEDVGACNVVTDETFMEVNTPPWLGGGSFTWPIPNAWRVSGDTGVTNLFGNTDQRFELDADGTARLKKFYRVGERMTNGVYRTWEER